MIPARDDGLPEVVEGGGAPILIVADHASSHVPAGIDLGVAPALMTRHMAVDIGVAPLARALAARLGCAALLATVSRLVCDLNRDEDAASIVPVASDGHAVPGNAALDVAGRAARIDRFHRPWHAAIAARIAAARPTLIISLHSFTPRLSDAVEDRPWAIGVLYNRDERAAGIAIPAFRAAGHVTGDNEPYSGRMLNATMDRHAEANGIPYLGLEVRQDLVGDTVGVTRWCNNIAAVTEQTRANLPSEGQGG